MQYVEKNSWKLITICYQKKITLWGGGAMVKDFTPHVEVKNSSPHTCNLSYLGYLGDLIK
jgi:hypothetical protein